MNRNDQALTSGFPPVFDHIGKHEVFPEVSHDENSRYNFLISLDNYIMSVLQTGNRVAFEKRVKPVSQEQAGRGFRTRGEASAAMKQDPHYQTWSALRRSVIEMRQQAGRSLVLRQIDELARKAHRLNESRPETLILDPAVIKPDYTTMLDHECLPGGYYAEYREGDVANGAVYDVNQFVATGGQAGLFSDGPGRAVAAWLKQHYPTFTPRHILDIGCGVGHNTLPLAVEYPDAQVTGIDVSAPMLRYGHARAVSLGLEKVRFQQANAEALPFDDNSFDWVQTSMFLHETSASAIQQIIREIYRVLAPGGVMLHVEQPQHGPDTPLFEKIIEDWDAVYNNEPGLRVIHDMNVKELMTSVGFNTADLLQFGAKIRSNPVGADLGYIWNVFGAWKK
jgi:ubiquinone/menaquinone biosynthesis C-methylase UbiE